MILVFATLVLAACGGFSLEVAQCRVPIGTPREEAVRLLSGDVWYHQPCYHGLGITDLFFYGSRTYGESQIIIMDSRLSDGVFRVEQVSSFESYAWHTAYRDGYYREMFQD